MTNAKISAALNAWKQFFAAGKDAKHVQDLDTLAKLAKQSGDAQLLALADLCVMLEAAWMNGARQAEAETAA